MDKAFEQPPKGPKLGPMKDFKDLPPHRQEQLGDLAKLGAEAVLKPAVLDPRIAEEERRAAESQLEEETPEGQKRSPEEVAEELEALHSVLDAEDELEPEPDPIEEQAQPTENDRRNFLRSILGEQGYAKEYVLFGGTLVLFMIDLLPEQEDAIFEQIAVDQREGVIETQEDWELQLDRYRAVTNVRRMLRSGTLIKESPEKSLRDRVETLRQTMNSTMYRSIIHVVRIFRRHLDIMVERALSPDFWEVDGHSSQSEPTTEDQSVTTETADRAVGS